MWRHSVTTYLTLIGSASRMHSDGWSQSAARVDTCSRMVMHGCGPGREGAVCGWGIALMRARTLARTFADGALRLGAESGTSRWRQVTPQTASVFTRFLALFGRTDGSDTASV